jgi:hypothetical protein
LVAARLEQPLGHEEQPGDPGLVANSDIERQTIAAAAPSAIAETVKSCRSVLTRLLPR